MITTIQTRFSRSAAPEAEFALPPDVIFVTVHDGSARLLDMAGRFHAVPAIGARMLQETLQFGRGEAGRRIAQEYGAAPWQVQTDLDVFLRELQEQGLLCKQGERRSCGGLAAGLARLFLRPALSWIHGVLRSADSKAPAILGLARLSFALLGWTRTIAIWKEAHAGFASRQADKGKEQAIRTLDQAVRAAAASHPFEVACKERALCCWALARAAGLAASLVVGIELFPLVGHCWCEVGPQTLSDDPDWCASFVPVGKW
jgi:hypothetical protein